MTQPMTRPMTQPLLEAEGVTAGYAGAPVLTDLSIAFGRGSVTALVGPNGSGKSTLLAVLARVLRPRAGVVRLDGAPVASLGSREVARRLALLPQSSTELAGTTAWEVVEQGRYPRRGPLSMLRRADDAVVREALATTGVAHLAQRRMSDLSGGERQRVRLAMAVAQESELLLLDEPTTYLDVRHQLDLMRLVGDLRARGRTIVMVLHDLNQAARYADRVVALRAGAVVADGTPDEVVTSDLLAEVFEVDATVTSDPVSGRPHFHAR